MEKLLDDLISHGAEILTALGTFVTIVIGAYNAIIANKNRTSIKTGNEMTATVGDQVQNVNETVDKELKDLRYTNTVLTQAGKDKDVQITRLTTENANARKIVDDLKAQLALALATLKESTGEKAKETEKRITNLEVQSGSRSGD